MNSGTQMQDTEAHKAIGKCRKKSESVNQKIRVQNAKVEDANAYTVHIHR